MISDNITAKALAIHEEALAFEAGEIDATPIATEVREKAQEAILNGHQGDPKSEPWITYMSLFATSDVELNRLIPTDGSSDPVRQKARAYLVANGMCSMGTTRNLPNNVGNRLDLP